MVDFEILSKTASRSLCCAALLVVGCRFGYEGVDLGDSEGTDGLGGNGACGGTRLSSDGGVLEGGAPGDSGATGSTGGTGGSGATGGASGSEAGGASSSGGVGGGGNGTAGASGGAGGSGGTAGASGGTGGIGGNGGAGTTTGGSGGASTTAGGSGGASTTGGGSGGGTSTTGGGTPPDVSSCVADTYGGHDYLLCAERRTWPDALGGCVAIGMSLVRIDDLAENDWLDANRNVTGSGSPPNVWIGASDAGVEDEWRWADGELFWTGDHLGMPENGLFANWYDREPNDVDLAADEDCGSLGSNRPEWFDSACDQLYPYICESL